MPPPPVVALEIGTSKILALVGEMREGGHVMITGMGRASSSGVRKGEVIDMENAGVCVRNVLAQAEEIALTLQTQMFLHPFVSYVGKPGRRTADINRY